MKKAKQIIEVLLILAVFILVGYIDSKAIDYIESRVVESEK